MNIRQKTLSVIAVSLLVSAGANYLVLQRSVWPSFLALEQQETARDMERIREVIKAEVSDVNEGLWDYSSWDDTYAYAKGENPGFPETYLSTDPLLNMGMDVIELYATDGSRLYQVAYDRLEGEMIDVSWSMRTLDRAQALFVHEDEESSISGIIETPRGPLLLGSRPIVKTSGEGPIAGTFFFGRFLDQKLVAVLREKIKVDFEILELDQPLAPEARAAVKHLGDVREQTYIHKASDQELTAYTLLEDFQGTPLLLVKAQIERGITSIGRRALLASAAGLVLAGAVVMAVTAAILQLVLVGPLIGLTRHVVTIGASGALGRRTGSTRRDEIGILSREFDKMLGNLKGARDQLLESSYNSGIAEMASGILHNLRNQLTPLNMRLDRMREAATQVGDGNAEVAIGEIVAENTAAERKQKMATYLSLWLEKTSETRKAINKDLEDVSKDLVRLDNVLTELDRFSRVKMQMEEVAVAEVVTRTISTIPTFPDVAVAIDISPDLRALPPVNSAGFVLRQILNNLFVNAIEAIAATGRSEGVITVEAEVRPVDGRPFIDLQIGDNGSGICEADLTNIFKRGFSTKKTEASGSGLHWSANTISAMQGRIYAQSPGPGQGATLHVLLPLADTGSKAAA